MCQWVASTRSSSLQLQLVLGDVCWQRVKKNEDVDLLGHTDYPQNTATGCVARHVQIFIHSWNISEVYCIYFVLLHVTTQELSMSWPSLVRRGNWLLKKSVTLWYSHILVKPTSVFYLTPHFEWSIACTMEYCLSWLLGFLASLVFYVHKCWVFWCIFIIISHFKLLLDTCGSLYLLSTYYLSN